MRLRQILINLVSNAVKFTEHGEVKVAVSPWAGDGAGAPGPGHLHFCISDTGIGISPGQQQEIFLAFKQADSSITRRYGGTGLGLSISSRLVHMMNGKIWVESQLGKGSQFHFTAQFQIPKSEADAIFAGPQADFGSLVDLPVLVVDDNAANRKIVTEMMTNWRMRPHAVEAAPCALRELTRADRAGEAYALVVVDAQMPDEDGFSLATKIQEAASLRGPIVMMLSSADCTRDVERCVSLGVAAYVTKPIIQSELFDAVASAIGSPLQHASTIEPLPATKQATRPLRVLLAEDNPVNRELAVSIVSALGHQVETVTSGHAVLSAIEQTPFDVVLMDIQMPGMDGLEAVREIRRREKAQGDGSGPRRRLRIIALTAHALKGDREACLAAGMDDYVAKPIRRAELVAALERFFTADGARPHETDGAKGAPFDRTRLLAGLNGNVSLLLRLSAVYFEHTPQLLQEISSAISSGRFEEVARPAHTLKGSLSQFSAEPAARCAAELETAARAGKGEFRDLEVKLSRQLEFFDAALRDFVSELEDDSSG